MLTSVRLELAIQMTDLHDTQVGFALVRYCISSAQVSGPITPSARSM